jgi:hypothetical protein
MEMMTLMFAAAVAAAQPAAPAPAAPAAEQARMQHDGMKKDCCKDCCKDMAGKDEGHAAHNEHGDDAK